MIENRHYRYFLEVAKTLHKAGEKNKKEGGPRPKARPWGWELQGGIVGGNV